MPPISQVTIAGFLAASASATNTLAHGRALEDMIEYVFSCVPGITITRRNTLNQFNTEEIDVAFWNDGSAGGLPFLPSVLLVECKNWSNKVGSVEVNWFDTKLRNRGLNFGILITTKGITGVPDDLTAAHSIIAAALREQRRLIVITVDDLSALGHSDDLVQLVKVKLCDLAVSGTIV